MEEQIIVLSLITVISNAGETDGLVRCIKSFPVDTYGADISEQMTFQSIGNHLARDLRARAWAISRVCDLRISMAT
jgi:hypothetical protein